MAIPTKISFPTYVQMYPYSKDRPLTKQLREKCRYYAYSFIYKKQCRQLIEFLNNTPQWQALFTQDYYRFNPLLTTYCDKRFSAAQRFEAITQNLNIAEEKLGLPFCKRLLQEQVILLSQLSDDLFLNLSLNFIDPFEGYFAINIRNQNHERIYDASFTFLAPNKLLISSIQGPSHGNTQELIKQATKDLHGIRPMFMLMHVFRELAKHWQCDLIGIPHKFQGKYRLSARSKILFNYDEFWQENQGIYQDLYWQLPLDVERKPLEEIASKKRSMYRKRYDMLDSLTSEIASRFS
ncbi:hypothetical protein BKG91_04655 [Rodentibacter caecimuris]|uniref:Uncharacterized protein n=1 Tax=Rodentibacter caecimuris TaxID=1796644 RepID=A0A9X8W036_9PAST|nr:MULTISPECIES: DUF535 family protein [Pasteurellaceae]MCQ9122583.1 DUF535 family protein [Rodentibacter heylii]MCX2961975.1 DUF535 family protein [Rodentibacter heylii]OOF71608.1 hypothetical protein BKG90_07585 [Rodentibacter heylii]OOF74862.1 hypothetical protein BKG91_04655 [Rodentibacter heylii]OOF77827.1 hypothetical protein BKG99_01900 [Rodentibacter heylii]